MLRQASKPSATLASCQLNSAIATRGYSELEGPIVDEAVLSLRTSNQGFVSDRDPESHLKRPETTIPCFRLRGLFLSFGASSKKLACRMSARQTTKYPSIMWPVPTVSTANDLFWH